METLLGFELSLVGYKEIKTKFEDIIDILHFGFGFWALIELSAFGTLKPLALPVWDVAPKTVVWILSSQKHLGDCALFLQGNAVLSQSFSWGLDILSICGHFAVVRPHLAAIFFHVQHLKS